MNLIELERHEDRRNAGKPEFRHFRFVVVTRGGMHKSDPRPTYTVWLSATREIGESRYAITQTQRLGYASAVARACASQNQNPEDTYPTGVCRSWDDLNVAIRMRNLALKVAQ